MNCKDKNRNCLDNTLDMQNMDSFYMLFNREFVERLRTLFLQVLSSKIKRVILTAQ
jgi:hypothetical protein